MEHMPGTLPADNPAMRTYIIRECLPALSLADLEALLAAVAHRLRDALRLPPRAPGRDAGALCRPPG